ncbi:Cilia- and flagella-associated protein 57 [Bagarius yarrelli]|uniref:Cilia-and flagella-associated protein 57 n=1 Tax=Bagarius yarrelli TaxID=175774 RepID=A0A556TZG3_BAGYA|nr:Cilia- and flagella-associated protein 57 [Bagarius yarrelli]
MALSLDHRLLAVSESGKSATIIIFELKDQRFTKKQILKGVDYDVHEFVCMAFSAHSEYLLAQAGEPTWNLFYWQWEKKELIGAVKTTTQGFISQVSFSPRDTKQICVTGRKVFKIFELKKDSLRQAESFKVENEEVLCHAWLSGDAIVAGTEAGQLLMLKSRRLHRLGKPYEKQMEKTDSSSSAAQLASVTAILRYSKGFVCSPGPGLVYLYDKTKEGDYRKTKAIRIPVNPNSKHPFQSILTICFSPSEDVLAISTDRGQLYHVSLSSAEVVERQNAEFKFLSHSFHSEGITGLSVCSTKPLIATCSKDYTVHIWNYRTMFLEQFKEFDKEPICLSMHPNGYSFLMGFSTEICLLYISNEDMRTVRRFPISNCTECVFNHDGNKFAAINGNVIHVYNLRTLKKLELIGHKEKVQSVKWRDDDRRLVSCGKDGTVFVWDSMTGNYEVKNEMECCYADVMFSPKTGTVLAVLFELNSYGEAITMTYSGRVIVVGTAAGTIRVIEYPFKKKKTWKEHQAHSGAVTKVAVTSGDQNLVTASEDGSILIWSIIDPDAQTHETVKEIDHSEEVLCTKATLAEKDQTIDELKSHVEWLKVEREFQMNERDVDCNDKMNKMKQPYSLQIETLKEQIQVSNTVIKTEKDTYQKAVAEMGEKHPKALNEQEKTLSKGIPVEFERHQETEQKMHQMQESFEKKQQTDEKSRLSVIAERKQVYDAQLQEDDANNTKCAMHLRKIFAQANQLIEVLIDTSVVSDNKREPYRSLLRASRKTQAKLEQEVRNSEENQKRIKDDATDEIMELSQDYDEDMEAEKEAVLRVQHEMQLMEKKISTYWSMKNVTDSQCAKIAKLKEEMQNLRSQYRDATNRLKHLKKEQKEQSKTVADQECTIEKLNKTFENRKQCLKERDDELVRVVLDTKKADEECEQLGSGQRKEIKRLGKIIEEDKETLTMISAEMSLDKKKNQEIISDLRQKLKTKDNVLDTVKQKVRNANILVERMKRDIHNCSRFIQEPRKLKEHFMALHMRFIHRTHPQVAIGVDAEVAQKRTRHIDHFHRLMDANKSVQSKENKAEKARYDKIKKECTFFTEQLKDQQLKHRQLLTDLKEKNIECDDTAEFPAIYVDMNRPVSKPQRSGSRKLQKNSSERRQDKSTAQQTPTSSPKSPPINPKKTK